jgi:hypothetical protein
MMMATDVYEVVTKVPSTEPERLAAMKARLYGPTVNKVADLRSVVLELLDLVERQQATLDDQAKSIDCLCDAVNRLTSANFATKEHQCQPTK